MMLVATLVTMCCLQLQSSLVSCTYAEYLMCLSLCLQVPSGRMVRFAAAPAGSSFRTGVGLD